MSKYNLIQIYTAYRYTYLMTDAFVEYVKEKKAKSKI